jgi:[ribosomal protein S18]-alanine N-acetyltransferase
MLELKILKKESDFNEGLSREMYVDFLHEHLDRFRDSKEDINACLDYAFSESKGMGGFLIAAIEEEKLAGALVMNHTGMSGFIPEHILVYIAVDSIHRGKGFGKQIIEESFKHCSGNVKLHVEYDNPAKRLYERIGFSTKYAEMRYNNKK